MPSHVHIFPSYNPQPIGHPLAWNTNTYTVSSLYAFLLNLLERVIRGGMHYSFGSSTERPHIVGPILNNVDTCVVTKNDIRGVPSPPTLGYDLRSDNESIDTRNIEWNTNDTYTLTFRSTFVDLVQWKIVNLPSWIGNGHLDLTRLWGNNAKLRIVAYDVRQNVDGNAVHARDQTCYLFCAEIEPLFVEQKMVSLSSNKMEIDSLHPMPGKLQFS
jgi:hypothetical protein